MKFLCFFVLIAVVSGEENVPEGHDGSTLFVQSVRPRTLQSVVEEEVQRVRRVKSEVFPALDKSYWTPYSDRTVLAMSFPILTHDIFTPVLLNPGEAVVKQKVLKAKVQKPKSDIGVIITRNTVLRENFRDYRNLSMFPKEMRPSDTLLVDAAKAFSSSQRAGRNLHSLKTEKLLGRAAAGLSNFVMVALETRVKYPKSPDAKHFGTFGNAEILRNGTISFPSARLSSLLVHIPFYFKSPQDIEHVFDNYNTESGHLVPQEKTEMKAFLKLVYGLHEDQFGDGDEAVQRILKRTRSLTRPKFVFPVEDDAESRADETLLKEADDREVMWLYTNSVAMRVLSSPIYFQHLVPVVPVVQKEPVVAVVPEPVVSVVQKLANPAPLVQKEAPIVPVLQNQLELQPQLPAVPHQVPFASPHFGQQGPYAPFFFPHQQQTFLGPQTHQPQYLIPAAASHYSHFHHQMQK